VLLLDEPCAGLDPIATARIEDTLQSLRGELTIVLATHHPQQAARVADRCAFFLRGELIEYSPANDLFTSPRDPRTEDYLTGKFG
jgi:phosphate transport system ATP-binding protein